MLGFGQQESRKFIDLLLQVTNNKWANIDANKEVKVGDFGHIDRATGELLVEGNLYDHPETRGIMEAYPIKSTEPTKFEKYLSKGVRELGITPNIDVGIQSYADVGFDGKWQFHSERGALLILVTPRINTMRGFPTSTILDKRFKPLLKNRVVCTDVVSCPAFCLYLGNNKDHVFELSLKSDVPIAAAAGVSVGGSLSTNWKYSNSQGLVKEGLSDKGEYVYYPLYSLKGVSWGKVGSIVRGTEGESEDEELLENVTTPWIGLDDDGDELDFEVDSGEPL
ncbi:hypothetical protein BDP27DRAFT_642944 [Rhodocollybia butyracea]|uniref:Uncharacterized protein n=1 Tax=Rhodocollybia butyracea TaxID=206335 RepID=A0A9P5PXS3_9AGAR|nr:hypothetical protein BDP27DRAFT_642944 [Rhodocollybia butyracea]